MQIPGHRFLVTGGAGFVGSHIVDRLLAADAAEVVVLDLDPRDTHLGEALESGRVRLEAGDVGDRERLTAVFAGVDGLFHAAVLPLNACTAGSAASASRSTSSARSTSSRQRARRACSKIVFSSASSVYGDTNETMDESHPLAARTLVRREQDLRRDVPARARRRRRASST